jgi:hypothetical protein
VRQLKKDNKEQKSIRRNKIKSENKLVGLGLLTAISASLCCIHLFWLCWQGQVDWPRLFLG